MHGSKQIERTSRSTPRRSAHDERFAVLVDRNGRERARQDQRAAQRSGKREGALA